jgi:hypothetical protein
MLWYAISSFFFVPFCSISLPFYSQVDISPLELVEDVPCELVLSNIPKSIPLDSFKLFLEDSLGIGISHLSLLNNQVLMTTSSAEDATNALKIGSLKYKGVEVGRETK